MVYEKTQTYELKGRSLDSIKKCIEDILQQKLNLTTKSARLDESLIIITFLDENKDKNAQKDNKIALFQEQNAFYVQIKGEIAEDQGVKFWSSFESLMATLETKGKEAAWNYVTELQKLEFLQEPNLSDIINVTESLAEERQKQVIERLKEIETEFNEVRNSGTTLTEDERARLRLDLIKFKKESRKSKIEDFIRIKAKKSVVAWDNVAELQNLGFLREPRLSAIIDVTENLPEDRQKQVIERLKEIETELNELKNKNITLFDEERAQLRLDLIKLKKENRKSKIEDFVRAKAKKPEKLDLSKDDIFKMIIKSIEEKGIKIEKTEAEEFLNNFQEQYNRLPSKDEVSSIASSYIKMMLQEAPPIVKQQLMPEEKEFSEEIREQVFLEEPKKREAIIEEVIEKVSPTDELMQKIKYNDFLSDTEKEYYIKLINELKIVEQKNIVSNLEIIQKHFTKLEAIPTIGTKEKVSLRKQLVYLSESEIEAKINEIIKASKEEESLAWDAERALRKLGFLTEANIAMTIKMVNGLAEDKQKQVVDRFRDIEKDFDELESDGISITDWERSQFRIDLVKLTEKNRKEKLLELVKDKKEELIKNRLHEEIPQLKYEDNQKIIKELIWLSKTEIEQRIKKIKENIQKQIEKNKTFSRNLRRVLLVQNAVGR